MQDYSGSVAGRPEHSEPIARRHRLSYEAFAREYLYPNRPVIVTGAFEAWPALQKWTPAFFKREFQGMKLIINDAEKGQAGYRTDRRSEYTMEEFIDLVVASTDENPAPYLRNQPLESLFPSLMADVAPLPDYFHPNWLPDYFVVKPVRELLNRGAAIELYIGGKGGAFPTFHYDGAGTHAFLMQVYGRKRYIVAAPDQSPYVYPSEDKPNLSLVNDPEHPDPARFPLFSSARLTSFYLEPGELLFVPSHWWHTAKILSPSITLSINVLNQSNWQELIDYTVLRYKNPFVSLAARTYLGVAGALRARRDRQWGPDQFS